MTAVEGVSQGDVKAGTCTEEVEGIVLQETPRPSMRITSPAPVAAIVAQLDEEHPKVGQFLSARLGEMSRHVSRALGIDMTSTAQQHIEEGNEQQEDRLQRQVV